LTAKVPEELAPEVREHKGALVYRLQRLEKLRRTDPHLQGLSDQELAEVVIAPCAHRELPDEIYYPPGCDIDAEWARLTASWDRPCQECAEARPSRRGRCGDCGRA
jgi:hypothetical protein